MSFQRRIATAPWPVLYVGGLALGGVAMAFVGWLYDRPDDPDLTWAFATALVVALTAGTVVGVVRRRRLRAQGRFEAVLDAGEAFRAGRVPADPAARAELVRMVPAQRRMLPLFKWGGPLIFGSQALLQASTAGGHPRVWLGAAIFAALALAYPVAYRRTRGRIARVEAGLAG